LLKGSKKRWALLENKVRHVYEVLREKEIAIERLRQEIEALRVVCQILHGEDDSAPSASESGGEGPIVELANVRPEGKADVLRRADEMEVSLARIRERLGSAQRNSVRSGYASALLQFREAALNASRAFLHRVRTFRSWEGESQRKSMRDLFDRTGRSNAA
jgi:hypothetical protein